MTDLCCPYCGSTDWNFDGRIHTFYAGLDEEIKEEWSCSCVCGKEFKRVGTYNLVRWGKLYYRRK